MACSMTQRKHHRLLQVFHKVPARACRAYPMLSQSGPGGRRDLHELGTGRRRRRPPASRVDVQRRGKMRRGRRRGERAGASLKGRGDIPGPPLLGSGSPISVNSPPKRGLQARAIAPLVLGLVEPLGRPAAEGRRDWCASRKKVIDSSAPTGIACCAALTIRCSVDGGFPRPAAAGRHVQRPPHGRARTVRGTGHEPDLSTRPGRCISPRRPATAGRAAFAAKCSARPYPPPRHLALVARLRRCRHLLIVREFATVGTVLPLLQARFRDSDTLRIGPSEALRCRHDRERPPWEPPFAGTEVEHLVGALDRLRTTFRWKADALDAAGCGPASAPRR